MKKIRNLCIILGDQLSHDSSMWASFDLKKDKVWMAEVMSESTNPLSSKQRTTVFFSAMRHFSEELRNKKIKVIYTEINDGISSFEEALEKTIAHYDIEYFQCVIPGDIRVYKSLNDFFREKEKSIKWFEDTSNKDLKYSRNKYRSILPELEQRGLSDNKLKKILKKAKKKGKLLRI